MRWLKFSILILVLLSYFETQAQSGPIGTPIAPPGPDAIAPRPAAGDEKPNSKRIRRQLNLIIGLNHDEELLIPDRETVIRGRIDAMDINRIAGTDYFRIFPKKAGSGIVTLNDKKTGQILVELRYDIRDDSIERTMREIQALLADVEGIEFKLINPPGAPGAPPSILIDGYVLLPKDLIRIYQVIANYPGVKSLVTLSPIARQKIAEFINREVNNPEVKVSAFGNLIKLEGQVNNDQERARIKSIVALYLPDIVTEKAPDTGGGSVQIIGRKNSGSVDDLIIDLMTVKPAEDKVDPPPKLIQIVAHFVKFNDSYQKAFNFKFSPVLSTQSGTTASANTGFDSTINLLSNLLPKLQWARYHGYAKVLDTASILIQDKSEGRVFRNISLAQTTVVNGAISTTAPLAGVSLAVKPTIKSERSGLVLLENLTVSVASGSKTEPTSTTDVKTTISVRDRQSAAFAGIIKKSSDTNFGA
ncbi:MAG: type II and III secretion system protein, partial [Bdellovibrionaceae bacterium]|nr:type II and III secretion system protein [Pseudobdellovibrionaceae bacterium]